MDLIDWSLSALDKVFSPGEASCPDGTSTAGYVRDYYKNWQVLCIEPLLIEDVEDLFVFGLMTAGFLLIGLGVALVYRKNGKTERFKNGKTERFTQQLSDINIKAFLDLSERMKELTDLNRNILFRTTEMQKTLGDSIKEMGTFRCRTE